MSHTRNQSGDTLVEVVLSLAIMAVVLVTAFNIATLSYRVGEQSRERTQAVNLAQEQAELLTDYRNQQVQAAVPTNGFLPGSCNVQVAEQADVALQLSLAGNGNACWFTPTSLNPTAGVNNNVSGLYNVFIQRLSKPAGDTLGANTAVYGVFVEWNSAIGNQTNGTELKVVLADQTNFNLQPCEDLTQC